MNDDNNNNDPENKVTDIVLVENVEDPTDLPEDDIDEIIQKAFQTIKIQNRIIDDQKKIIGNYKKTVEKYKKKQEPSPDIIISKEETTYDDVGGLDEVISEIRQIEYGISYPKMYDVYGIKPPNGLLVHGPPGCGKTMIAKAMSNELECWFMELPITQIISKWVGEAEQNLEQAIIAAKEKYLSTGMKVMLFVDEAEQMFRKRGAYSHGVLDRCVSVWLRTMDGMGSNDGLVFVAATNHLEDIDDAVLRAGRFDYLIKIPRPNREGVEDILVKQMKMKEKIAEREIYKVENVTKLADQMYAKSVNGADIAEILKIASLDQIKYFIETDTERSTIYRNEIFIYDHQLEKAIELYKRDKGFKEPRKVGFRV